MRLDLTAAVALGALLLACGGGQSGAASPDRSESGEPGPDQGRSPGGAESSESEEGTPGASCDDDSCFRCGEGICPKGFYCDRDAQGGAACAWLPACAAEPSCSCIKAELGASCSCSEERGGISVGCE